jgi:membrane peptidoglycan carboxypeptidase
VGFTPYLSTAVWMGAPEGSVEMRNVGGVSGVTGGSFPARIWAEFNTAYHDGRDVKHFVEPERTRSGTYLRTEPESRDIARFANSACGSSAAEVDTNGDGVVDLCQPGTVTRYRDRRCPRLMVAVDTDLDEVLDSCVPRP